MSLNKQMIMFVVSVLMMVLVGTFYLNFSQTKSYLENQLESHAQDTATSLGLSLSSVADPEDSSSMETMINAVFDRGSYSHIALIDMLNEPIYFRAKTQNIAQVPSWFIDFVPIHAPTAESLVQSGWMPIGKLKVKSDNELAYIKMWENTISLSILFVFAMFITVLLAYFSIKLMLRPLKKLEEQAEAIVRKEYLIQKTIPKTTEFKNVVIAMNAMVTKMKSIFDKDAKMAEKLQKMAYRDSLTGLSNRVHFDMTVESLLDVESEATSGSMCLIRIHNLKELNDRYGYLTGDKFMQLLAEKLTSFLDMKNALSARLNGTELVVMAPSARISFSKNMQLVYDHVGVISEQLNTSEDSLKISVGLIDYKPGEKRTQLLTRLDYAINKAQSSSCDRFHYETDKNQKISKQVWKETIDFAIENRLFILFQQSSCYQDRTEYSKELFIRLKDSEGCVHSAGYFMPAVEQLSKEMEVDLLVIDQAFKYLNSLAKNSKETISINLSSIQNSSFIAQVLNKVKTVCPTQVLFEISEKLVLNNSEKVNILIKEFNALGVRVGIDNFGIQFSDLTFLQDLRPEYIKLDTSFSHSIEVDEQTKSYVSSLVGLCDNLDIDVIAMSVETDAQLQAFSDLGVNLYQGFLFNAPKPLKE